MQARAAKRRTSSAGRKEFVADAATHRINVYLNQRPAGTQPAELFRICPLGLQFYSDRKVPQFSVLSFRMNITSLDGLQEEVRCSGVVVHCQWDPESRLHRIWVKFVDLSEATQTQLNCMARAAELTCPHCENF